MAEEETVEQEYTPENVVADWSPAVAATARIWGRKYAFCVEAPDVAQELWLWLLKPETRARLQRRIAEEGTKAATRKVSLQLRDRAKGYCITEQAKRAGFRTSDLSWYNTGQLIELLPAVFDEQEWIARPVPDGDVKVRSTSRPDEGGNRVATLADVSWAFSSLRRDDQRLLLWRFAGSQLTNLQIAERLGVDEDAAGKRVTRALQRLLDRLGGTPPIWPQGMPR